MATYMQAVNISLPNAALLAYPGHAVDGRRRGRLDVYLVYRGERDRHADDALARGPLWPEDSFSDFDRHLRARPHARHARDHPDPVRRSPASSRGPRAARSLRCRWRSCSMCCRPRATPGSAWLWTACLLLGISSGPSIGGWLSEYHGWPSIFYFSLPMTGFIFLAMALSLPEKQSRAEPALRLLRPGDFLARHDRAADAARPRRAPGMVRTRRKSGPRRSSRCLGFYLFIVHVLTAKAHFLNKALFRDRNFVLSTIMLFRRRLRPAADLGPDLADAGGTAQLSGRHHRLHDHPARRHAASGRWC